MKNHSSRYILHIFVLCSLGISQPLLDIISKNAELLVASRISTADLLLLLLVLLLIVPALLCLPGLLAKVFFPAIRTQVFSASLGFIAGLVFLIMLKNIVGPDSASLVVFAALAATGFMLLYHRHESIRFFCSCMSPALLVIPLLFMMNGNIFRVVRSSDVPIIDTQASLSDTPVVMVVFDELPIISLLDESAAIDPLRYPNFAALADDSYWYRNAQTVSAVTTTAVPAILSGVKDEESLPVVADYPLNLFTLLQPSHRLQANEIVTSLCPRLICEADIAESSLNAGHLEGFLADLAVVYLYTLMPTELTTTLPTISQSWGGFTGSGLADSQDSEVNWTELAQSRVKDYSEFLASIQSDTPATFYFYHALLPHMPWEFLPSGKLYSSALGDVAGLVTLDDRWGSNELLVTQGYQRHLLQLGFVDKLLGDLIERLKAENLYQQAAIVIVSDHGANFLPDSKRRDVLDPRQTRDVSGIALLIKQPGQDEGIIDDSGVTTLDIFPTLSNLLGISPPDRLPGNDLFAARSATPPIAVYDYTEDSSLKRKISLFGSGDMQGLYESGDYPELLWRNSSEFSVQQSATLSFQLDQQGYLENIDTQSSFIPARLTGTITGLPTDFSSIDLAVALNDKLVATSQSFDGESFSIVVPEVEFRDGRNRIELFQIHRASASSVRLESIENQRSTDYHYTNSATEIAGSSLSQSARNFSITPESVRGNIDSLRIEGEFLFINGWAASVDNAAIADFVLLDVDEQLIYLGSPNTPRPDVAEAYDIPAFTNSGFLYRIPLSQLSASPTSEIRFIGVSERSASSIYSLNFSAIEAVQ